MRSEVLTTKIHPPPVATRLIARPELLTQFARGLERPVTLVCAPAGFGKTTLVAQWLAACHEPVAWFSLDEQDSDPVRFLTYLIHALQSVAPVGQSVLNAMDAGTGSIAAGITSLMNELDARDDRIVLVLDDYHELDSPEIDRALQMLVDHMPRSLRLIIISREDPPIAATRLRARAHLSELRARDLRFTRDDAGSFLRESMGLDLSDDDIHALEQRTEGWVAGLQLAAVSLRDEPDVSRFIASFSASHRFVLDYLLEEVFERQPAWAQDFLVETSILDRFCAPLCDTVLSAAPGSSEATIRHLERVNLFVVPLDSERRWYRYHHLFRQLLFDRAAHAPALHLRASQWFEENDLSFEAFRHAAAGGDVPRALRLVYSGEVPLYFRGHARGILNWIESLPDDVARETPELRIHHGWILWTAHQSDAAAAVLDGLPDLDRLPPRLRGLVAALRAVLASNTYDTGTIMREARAALELLGQDDGYVRLSVMRTLAVAHHYLDEREQARDTYREVIRESQRTGNQFMEILATTGLGMVEESELHLEEARTLHTRVIDLVGEPTQPVACAGWLGLARIAYQRNHLEDAAMWARRGTELAEAIEGIDVPVEGAVLLARIAYAAGTSDDGDAILDQAEARAGTSGYAVQLHAIACLRVRRLARSGRVADARTMLASAELGPLEEARVEIAAGAFEAAGALLEPYVEAGPTDERAAAVVLSALALVHAGRLDEGVACVAPLMPALRAENNIRFLSDEGPAVVPLLEECVRAGIEPAFATRVLAVLDAGSPRAAEAARWEAAGLSRRELEVLRLLAGGLSNKEIAAQLFVSLSTVKGHTTRIFEKLGASRRTEAVARARERGLV